MTGAWFDVYYRYAKDYYNVVQDELQKMEDR